MIFLSLSLTLPDRITKNKQFTHLLGKYLVICPSGWVFAYLVNMYKVALWPTVQKCYHVSFPLLILCFSMVYCTDIVLCRLRLVVINADLQQYACGCLPVMYIVSVHYSIWIVNMCNTRAKLRRLQMFSISCAGSSQFTTSVSSSVSQDVFTMKTLLAVIFLFQPRSQATTCVVSSYQQECIVFTMKTLLCYHKDGTCHIQGRDRTTTTVKDLDIKCAIISAGSQIDSRALVNSLPTHFLIKNEGFSFS